MVIQRLYRVGYQTKPYGGQNPVPLVDTKIAGWLVVLTILKNMKVNGKDCPI